jgi:hypothetical protein
MKNRTLKLNKLVRDMIAQGHLDSEGKVNLKDKVI